MAMLAVMRDRADAATVRADQINEEAVLEHADALRSAHAGDEGVGECSTGLIAPSVDDAVS